MNSMTEQLTSTFKPYLALVVYRCEQGKQYYIESHPIENGQMMAGKALDEDTLSGVVNYYQKDFATRDNIKGALPEELLYCEWNASNKVLIWYNKPQPRMMHFTSNLHIRSGEANQPGLIYIANETGLYVLATKAKGRPRDKDLIYIPPYHNCSCDGHVCIGSARVTKPKECTYRGLIDYYERLFWGSEFSHLAGANSIIKGNINTYWKKAIKTKQEFDNNLLQPVIRKMKFSDLIKVYTK